MVIAGGVTKAGDKLSSRYGRGKAPRPSDRRSRQCRIVPVILPGTAGVVGAIATFKAQKLGTL